MREHESWSSLSMWARCGMQYYYRYVMDLKIPPGLALVGGSSVHKTLEDNYTKKIKTYRDLELDDFIGIFRDTFEEKSEEMEKVSGIADEVFSYTQNMERCLEIYHKGYAPSIMPSGVEIELKAKLDGTEILGYLDLITEEQLVVDHKTSSKSPHQDVAKESQQLTLYGWLCMENNIETAGLRLDYLVARKEPVVQQLETTRRLEDIVRMERELGATLKGIKAEVFAPTGVGTWVCNPKYCGYYKRCRG